MTVALFAESSVDYVLRTMLRLGAPARDAEDLAQEVFFKAHRYRHGFRGDARLSTWLYAITRNHCLSSLRKKAAEPVEIAAVATSPIPDLPSREPEPELVREQMRRRMWRAVHSQLDPVEARVMVLHYAHEVPMAVITRRLELSNPSGAKAHVVNARRKLRALMARQG